MKAKKIVIGLGLSALILPAHAVLGAPEEKGAASVSIKSIQGSVAFPHGRHQKIFVDCRPCHELFPKTPNVIAKMMGEGTLKKKEVMDMCKKCHEVRAAKGEKAGPTACKDCHVK